MIKLSDDAKGYVLTAFIVVGLLALLCGMVWLSAHRPKDPAYTPEFRCEHIDDAEICQRVRPPSPPTPPRKP